MVGTHRNVPVRATLGAASLFFFQHRRDHRHHVGVALKVHRFVKRIAYVVAFHGDIPQMQKMHAVAQIAHHAGQVVVRTRAETPRAERDAVRGNIHGAHDLRVVLLGRHHPRQTEKRKRRVVRMTAETKTQRLRHRRNLAQKVSHMRAQRIGVNSRVVLKVRAHILKRETLRRARQTEHDVFRQTLRAFLVHLGETARRLVSDLLRIILGGARPLENVNVKDREVGKVKAHAGRAARTPPGEIGARPVQDGHEVVTDHLNSGIGDMRETLFPVLNVGTPVALLLFNVLRHRQTFNDLPLKSGGRAVAHVSNRFLPRGDLLGTPDLARRNMMKRRNHALHARLKHVVDRDMILRSEPAPGLSHKILR